MNRRGPNGTFFRNLALASVSLVLLLVVAGLTLTARGRAEMRESDSAFHAGDLRGAVVHAKAAALAYVPGSNHVLSAYARLEAVAKGAEAAGDGALSRLAWETLRSVHRQTDYPGRPVSAWQVRAEQGLKRLDVSYEQRGH